ncbi:MAG: HEPN domain-containing protein [Bacteroidetes bacterium]|nr:HEPN domain-containing protein [Bacteroidota bacterium]
MKPFSIYQAAFDGFQQTQERIVSLIQEVAQVDRIYLLGGSLHRHRTESIFNQLAPSLQYVSDCYCLVLVPTTQKAPLMQLQDQIEQHCARVMPATILLLATSQFDGWLADSHAFAIQVYQSAPLLLQTDEGYKGITGQYDEIAEQERTAMIYKDGLKKAEEFLAGADLYRLRKQNKMAAFMLHQAAEQALGAMVKIGTGYYSCTHNIERLLRYAGMVTNRVTEVFPKNTEPEKRLVTLLQKAYIDSRYKEDYFISETDLLTLTDRTQALKELLQTLRGR